MLTILLYAIIVFAVLYVSAGLGAAMDLSVDDEGVLDFNLLMTEFEKVLTSTDIVGNHFTNFSSYSFKITLNNYRRNTAYCYPLPLYDGDYRRRWRLGCGRRCLAC